MKIIPKNGYLVVREPDRETETKGGLIIPESANVEDPEQTTYGEILECEEGSDYEVGDIVLFPKVLPNDFSIELVEGKPEVVWFLHYEQVMGVLKK